MRVGEVGDVCGKGDWDGQGCFGGGVGGGRDEIGEDGRDGGGGRGGATDDIGEDGTDGGGGGGGGKAGDGCALSWRRVESSDGLCADVFGDCWNELFGDCGASSPSMNRLPFFP